jgi:hypothetical protein
LHVECAVFQPWNSNRHFKSSATQSCCVRHNGKERTFVVAKGCIEDDGGRTLAVMPKSTSQISPRRAFGMVGLGFVVG